MALTYKELLAENPGSSPKKRVTFKELQERHGFQQPTRDVFDSEDEDVEVISENRKGFSGVARGLGQSIIRGVQGLGEFGQNIAQQTAGRVVESITGTPKEDLGSSFFERGTKEFERGQEIATPKTGAEKIGFFGGEVIQFALPGGKVFKATAKLSSTSRLLSLAGSDTAVELAKSGGDVEKAAKTGVFSFAIPTAGKGMVNLSKKVAGGLLLRTAATLGGRGSDIIEAIFRNPDEALKSLNRSEAESLRQTAKEAIKATDVITDDASNQYGRFLESLPNRIGRKGRGSSVVEIDGSKVRFTKEELKDKIVQGLDDFGVQLDDSGQVLLENSPLLKAEEDLVKKAFGVIDRWTDWSPRGINELATKLRRFTRGGADVDAVNNIISRMKTTTRQYIGDKIPSVAEENLKYAKEMEFVENIDDILKSNVRDINDENIRDVAKRISTLFSGTKELEREAVGQLGERAGVDILAQEAGRQLSEPTSRTTAGLGDALKSVVQILIPPRLVGNVVARSSKAKNLISQPIQTTAKLAESLTGKDADEIRKFGELLDSVPVPTREALLVILRGSSSSED